MFKRSIYTYTMTIILLQQLFAYSAGSVFILKKFDKNCDNRISFAEASSRMQENFHIHDHNRDGYIMGKELNTLPKPELKKSSYPPKNKSLKVL